MYNEEHPANIELISVTLHVSHFDISGIDNNDEQLKNIPLIFVTFSVFHLDISGSNDNEEHIIKIFIFINIPF